MNIWLLLCIGLWFVLTVFMVIQYDKNICMHSKELRRLQDEYNATVGIDSSARAYANLMSFYTNHEATLAFGQFREEKPLQYWQNTIVSCAFLSVPAFIYTLYLLIRRP